MNDNLEDCIEIIFASSHVDREYIMENDQDILDEIEASIPEVQLAFLGALEWGLSDQSKLYTKDTFEVEYDRALKLYYKICKDHNLDIELEFHYTDLSPKELTELNHPYLINGGLSQEVMDHICIGNWEDNKIISGGHSYSCRNKLKGKRMRYFDESDIIECGSRIVSAVTMKNHSDITRRNTIQTFFPPFWSDRHIHKAIVDIRNDESIEKIFSHDGIYMKIGIIHDVRIVVICHIESNEIITAYPHIDQTDVDGTNVKHIRELTLDDHILYIYAMYHIIEKEVIKNNNHVLDKMEISPNEIQYAFLAPLENALISQSRLFPKDVFEKKYSRALELYHRISNEHKFKFDK